MQAQNPKFWAPVGAKHGELKAVTADVQGVRRRFCFCQRIQVRVQFAAEGNLLLREGVAAGAPVLNDTCRQHSGLPYAVVFV